MTSILKLVAYQLQMELPGRRKVLQHVTDYLEEPSTIEGFMEKEDDDDDQRVAQVRIRSLLQAENLSLESNQPHKSLAMKDIKSFLPEKAAKAFNREVLYEKRCT